MIEDADAVKPEDWNEEEPTMVPDSTTPKPAEWCGARAHPQQLGPAARVVPSGLPETFCGWARRGGRGGAVHPRGHGRRRRSDEDDGDWEAPLVRTCCDARARRVVCAPRRLG